MKILKRLERVNAGDFLKWGLKFHGYKCPAMSIGLRTGVVVMNKLRVGSTGDSAGLVLVELGKNYCVSCFVDGVQVITDLHLVNIKKAYGLIRR